jgi:hypothetical protein
MMPIYKEKFYYSAFIPALKSGVFCQDFINAHLARRDYYIYPSGVFFFHRQNVLRILNTRLP